MKIVYRLINNYAYIWLLSLVTLFILPTLKNGLILDDYLFWQRVHDPLLSLWQKIFNLHGLLFDASQQIATGDLPWWSDPQFKIKFFRPLASLLFFSDIKLFGRHILFYNIHSLIWLYALVLLWFHILKNSVNKNVAFLAQLLFICSGTYFIPTIWLANRHYLMAVVFGLLGFWCYLVYRQEKKRKLLCLSLLSFAASLLSSEAAVSGFFYLFTYEWFVSTANRWQRGKVLLPWLILLSSYLCWYALAGQGPQHSGFYLNPVAEPWVYLQNIVTQLLDASMALFTGIIFENMIVKIFAASVCAVVIYIFLCKQNIKQKSICTWLLLSSLLAMLPATLVAGKVMLIRTLLFPALGITAFLAFFIMELLQNKNKLFFILALLLISTHAFNLPRYVNKEKNEFLMMNADIVSSARQLAIQSHCEIVMNIFTPLYSAGMYTKAIRQYYGLNIPTVWYNLSPHSVYFKKIHDNEILLAPMNNTTQHRLEIFTPQQLFLKNGDVVKTQLFHAQILTAYSNVPGAFLLHFEWNSQKKVCWL